MSSTKGCLRLHFHLPPGDLHTRLDVQAQEPPLKVIRAFKLDDGAALVHLHNISGGVLGGDQLALEVRVGPNASAQLTTTSATRIYRQRAGAAESVHTSHMAVDENGLLEMLPDPVIPFAGSVYRQQTQIELADGAGLFWWETIAPGREAHDERFGYERLTLETYIRACGQPIAIERARLEPHLRPLNSLARLGPFRYFSTFYICRVGLPTQRWTALEAELAHLAGELSHPGETKWGVSTLVAHGLAVRALSREGRSATTGLLAFWRAAKRALYGRQAVLPRKIY
jgi:urease accessory protein